MSDDTYYTVLNVKETASISEIKTAHRDLIKQVHPDTIANLAPYLRRIAEDKAKEINEAYTVLSNSRRREDYDRQLAEYRRQTTPEPSPTQQATSETYSTSSGRQTTPEPPPSPPPTQQTTSQTYTGSPGSYCNRCGTSLFANGFCPKCHKFSAPAATSPRPKPLMRWPREHPILALAILPLFCGLIVGLYKLIAGPASNQPRAIHPVAENPAPGMPPVLVSGTYNGTVYNQTVNLGATFTVVINQAKDGVLSGCMAVKPPLDGSGTLRGSVRSSSVNFAVADMTFHGSFSWNEIAGSFVVARPEGNQLGEFRLVKQAAAGPAYHCDDGVLTGIREVASPSSQHFSDLPPGL